MRIPDPSVKLTQSVAGAGSKLFCSVGMSPPSLRMAQHKHHANATLLPYEGKVALLTNQWEEGRCRGARDPFFVFALLQFREYHLEGRIWGDRLTVASCGI